MLHKIDKKMIHYINNINCYIVFLTLTKNVYIWRTIYRYEGVWPNGHDGSNGHEPNDTTLHQITGITTLTTNRNNYFSVINFLLNTFGPSSIIIFIIQDLYNYQGPTFSPLIV